jgi:hypothetical protein
MDNIGFETVLKWDYEIRCSHSWCQSNRVERTVTPDGEVILTCLSCGNTTRKESDHG